MIRYLLPLLLAGAPAAALAQTADQDRYQACLDKAAEDAEEAYEDGLVWRMEGGGLPARHCIAVALLALGETREAAERLRAVAHSSLAGPESLRLELLIQSGNAFLVAEAPEEAASTLTEALELNPGDAELLVDLARAHAMRLDYAAAEQSLDAALAADADNALALTLRADARLRQDRLDAAEADAEAAIAADPEAVEPRLVLGDIREARRTGEIPDR